MVLRYFAYARDGFCSVGKIIPWKIQASSVEQKRLPRYCQNKWLNHTVYHDLKVISGLSARS